MTYLNMRISTTIVLMVTHSFSTGIEPYLLITDGGNIHALSTDGTTVRNVIPASQQASTVWVVDFHFK